jgi:hypothetical protein
MPRQSQYKPINPNKYAGNLLTIVARSNLERSVFKFLDTNSSVKRWSSEEVVVKYWSPVDDRERRYFIDLYVELIDGTKLLVEIKPQSQTSPPSPPKKATPQNIERFRGEQATWITNRCKWKAAEDYAFSIGARFVVWTESSMLAMGIPGFRRR